jgi:MFS family permease
MPRNLFPMRTLAAYRGVLTIREARVLVGASAASQVGDWLYNAALLGYVFSATHSAAWVGAATIFRLLPYVLLGPFGGAIADRYARRRVLVVGSLLRMGLMLVLAAVIAADGPVALVIAIVALASAAGSAEQPAAMALLPRLVGEGRLGPANALLHTVQDLAVVVGPAIGALLLAFASAPAAFVVNGGTFAVSALLFSTLGRHKTPVSAARSHGAVASVVAGLRTARVTPFVIPLFALVAAVEFTYGAQTVQLVIYADRSLDLGAGGYGLLLAASGAGGLVSAVFNGQLATSRRMTLVVVSAAVLACASQFVYAISDVLTLALIVTAAAGAGLVCSEVVAETVVARVTPGETLGRIAGLFDACSIGAMVGGAVLASILVNATSLEWSFWILGAGAVLVALACSRGLRGLDEASRKRTEALARRLAIVEHLPITTGTPQLVLEQLASSSQLCPLPPGVDVVVQGSPAHAFYAIDDGRVVVRRDGVGVAHLGAGDSFGERGLLDNAPRNATVTTEVDTTVLRIEGAVLLEALERAPMLTTALNHSNAGRGGVDAAAEESQLIDDPRWTKA